jgi:hypothetical protein
MKAPNILCQRFHPAHLGMILQKIPPSRRENARLAPDMAHHPLNPIGR